MLPAVVLSISIRAELWRPLEKQGKAEWINGHVFATVRPIGTKFGLVTHNGPPNRNGS